MLYFEVIICSLSYKRLRFISEVNALSGRDVILFEDKSLKKVKESKTLQCNSCLHITICKVF